MSCLGKNYNPIPPREWSRVENRCPYDSDVSDTIYIPQLGETFPLFLGNQEIRMIAKGNVLQYKKNAYPLTTSQKYSQIAKGQWINRNTTWAIQGETYTNPNTQMLKRINGVNIDITDRNNITKTIEPISCFNYTIPTFVSLPQETIFIKNETNPIIPPEESNNNLAIIMPSIESNTKTPNKIIISDGGSLLCNQVENICTGYSKKSLANKKCNPTSDSDVPGKIINLCYNTGLPTYYPRQRYVMTNSANKFPVNSVLFPA
uniref:Uncharacterized protein n=1 Tax=viral metagenome TaxID=1070528 RepID=A0A6C0H5K3_9ZZZZ